MVLFILIANLLLSSFSCVHKKILVQILWFHKLTFYSWKFSVTWWRKPIAHCFILFSTGKNKIFDCICIMLNPCKTQQLSMINTKEYHIFSRPRDHKILSSAEWEQLCSQSMAVELGGWCRHVGVGNFLHCHIKPKHDGWTLTQHTVTLCVTLCSFDIWLVYSMNTSLPHTGIETP